MIDQKVFYKNEIDGLKQLVQNSATKNIFLVRGGKSFQKSGADNFINQLVGNNKVTSFFDFDPNPQLEDLKKGIKLFNENRYDLIIAIGGGSVIDMAKLISVFAHQNQNLEDIVLGKSKLQNVKTSLIAISTTAGTGAEATHFAVLYMGKKKYSIAHTAILPNTVYLSSEFSLSTSKYLTACTGLDAFCQAIESIWSVNANTESEKYALTAIDIIWNNLTKAVQENDSPAKEKMQEASFLAGKAINITKTTAPHALSYAFTSYYSIPHGHAVALSLPFFLNYNYQVTDYDCTDKRGADAVKKRIDKILDILDVKIEMSNYKLETFFNSLGINISISALITNFDKNIIINNINTERLNNNPRKITEKTIIELLTT